MNDYKINDDYLGGVIIQLDYSSNGIPIGGLMTTRYNHYNNMIGQGDWQFAKDIAANCTWLGFDDWRLITKWEFENYIFDWGYPELNMEGVYWSSDKMSNYPYDVCVFVCGATGSPYEPPNMGSVQDSFTTGLVKVIRNFIF